MKDLCVVGAGLAGSLAAWRMSERADVVLIEAADQVAAGASGVAAGIINPFMGRRVRPVWELDESMETLHEIIDALDDAELLTRGVFRPARDERQADDYRTIAREHARWAEWIDADAARERWPQVRAPLGGLFVPRGGAVDLQRLVQRLVHDAVGRRAALELSTPLVGFEERPDHVRIHAGGTTFEARQLLLAPGQGWRSVDALHELPLHDIKGQVAYLSPSEPLSIDTALSGHGYVAPRADAVVAGSSYEHDFDDLEPSMEVARQIREKVSRMVPSLADATIENVEAGARVTVQNSRHPILDRLPGHEHTFVFVGLGSKGLLAAPRMSSYLADALEDPETIPEEHRMP